MQLNFFNRPYFENGSINKISEVLKLHGIKNPLICTDPGLASIGMTEAQARSCNLNLKIIDNNHLSGVLGWSYWIWRWLQYGFRKSCCYDG